jgi:adenylyltransferase/sulfurtransferase
MDRYIRHSQLSDFGSEAQTKVSESKVLVIGAGGLGCPVMMALVAMGVGQLGIMDGDKVELSNLHRQYLYAEKDIGRLKSEAALCRLREMNSDILLDSIPFYAEPKNVFDIVETYDIIVDGTDRIPTRYLINDVCVALRKPLVYGSVFRYEGQVSVFNLYKDHTYSANYRDVFPSPNKNIHALSCSEVGVLGILPHIIGGFMANEAIKLITQVGEPLANKMLYYNLKTNHQTILNYSKNVNNIPITQKDIECTDYHQMCCHPGAGNENFIHQLLKDSHQCLLIDVREEHEKPDLPLGVRIPLKNLEFVLAKMILFPNLVFICQSGKRSKIALAWAERKFPDKKIYHYEPGVVHFVENM